MRSILWPKLVFVAELSTAVSTRPGTPVVNARLHFTPNPLHSWDHQDGTASSPCHPHRERETDRQTLICIHACRRCAQRRPTIERRLKSIHTLSILVLEVPAKYQPMTRTVAKKRHVAGTSHFRRLVGCEGRRRSPKVSK